MKSGFVALLGAASMMLAGAATAAAPVAAPAASAQKLSLGARAGAKSGAKSHQLGAGTLIPAFLAVAVVAIAVGTSGNNNSASN